MMPDVPREDRMRVAPRPLASLAAAVLFAGCVVVPDPAMTPGAEAGALPPPGFGTLHQDDVTMDFSSGDLQIKVTPLAESVVRTTAPDTERRLRSLQDSRRADAEQAGGTAASMFLVQFFSMEPDVAFVPEELQMLSRGTRLRPLAILAVTPTWGQRRLRQRETEMAVYVFPTTVDLESDLVVAYGLVENRSWSAILPQVQAERARARARGGVGQ